MTKYYHMKSKFWNLYRQFVTEQQDPELPQSVANIEGEDGAMPENVPPQDQPDITEQTPGQQLDSSGFVTMVRLLKDAFVIRPEDEDAGSIMELSEINGTNSYESFRKILTLIKKYNTEVDIDIPLNMIPK